MITKLSSHVVYQNAWMTVSEDQVEFANQHQGIYGVVHKPHFALIIPFDGEHFHMVQQYRYPTGQVSIEFPQGKHEDNPLADPLELAQAELQEETGFRAGTMQHLGFLYQAPGFSDQGFHIFLGTQLEQGAPNLDVTEADLVQKSFTPTELEAAIRSGEITDAPTVSAYGLWNLYTHQHDRSHT